MTGSVKNDLRRVLNPPIKINEKHLQETILKAKQVCPPAAKKVPLGDVFAQQVRFIGTKTWVFQAVILLVTVLLVRASTNEAAMAVMPVSLPIILAFTSIAFLLPAVVFLDGSVRYGMEEIELATMVSRNRLLAIRGILAATGSAVGLVCTVFVTGYYVQAQGVQFIQLIPFILLPHLLANSICLLVINLRRGRSSTAQCIVACAFLFVGLAVILGRFPELYAASAVAAWYVACAGLLAICVLEFYILLKRGSDLASYSEQLEVLDGTVRP